MEIKEVLKKLGIESLSDMQKAVKRAVLETKKDIVVLSPTGSGKTLAYLLPLVQRMKTDVNDVQAIVLVPGRELAQQSAQVLKAMGAGVRGMALYGGKPTMEEHRLLRKEMPHIVFATPGRMNDHLSKENIEALSVKWLIIDEFDKCLQMGFQDEMEQVISKLPSIERRILLSATDADDMPRFVNMGRTSRFDYREDGRSERLKIYKVESPQKDKLETLSRLLRQQGSTSSVVFLNHRDSVERTASYLRSEGFAVSMLHGGLDQKQREDALYRFCNASANVLVCTDLASRGLDIPDVGNIIHYHLPETQDAYVHRVGRTARWDKSGNAFFLLGPSESAPSYLEEEPELFTLDEQLPPPAAPLMVTLYIGKGKRDKISKADVVGFLCKKGELQNKEIGRIDVRDRYCYVAIVREKVNQVLKKTNGEKIKGVKTLIELVK
ncbi:MAG: DEAD/DEAH box helicase [Prevotella sp.]|nr:DEAD/DEAH box helicase [Prevotella sp.]